ncbi:MULTISPECIES: hypothetical protein [Pontibacillus]|uniref:DUF4083 domain-containing protein n=1 Tax=Pontibacillus chungwhensis TaxID=265426 RepID=A0ABY8V3E8_9BACI|nr:MULTISPECIES: hypothetical protein [Pontibacillus]MCD5324574.1 hypothetical protein [Pontibacillus sp. HN14]WIF99130.1 hypothetical protein QNI29_05600 [Pontibacillus chungwhensis]
MPFVILVSFLIIIYLSFKVHHLGTMLKKQQKDQEEMKSLLKIIIKNNEQ